MKRFIVRLAIATALSWLGWLVLVTPFDRLPMSRDAVSVLARVLNFPAAVAGELTYPLRGEWLIIDDGVTWCDFCSIEEHQRYQMEVAIPAYLFLLYLPSWLRRLRGNRRLILRIALGLLVYAAFAIPYCAIAAFPRVHVPYAAKWLLILASAATITWSNASIEWRSAGVIAVILDGAWAMAVLDLFRSFKLDSVLSIYPPHLATVFTGVVTFLWLVWGFEKAAERLQIFHPGVAHDTDDGRAGA